MHPEIPPERAAAIRDALFQGRKIEAIKIYREKTRCTLAQAKHVIEGVESELRRIEPDKFQVLRTPAGCGRLMVLILIAFAIAAIAALALIQSPR